MTPPPTIPSSSTPTGGVPPPANTQSGRALASLICGILSLICFGFMAGIPAIILGKMELNAIDRGESPESNRNLAKIGFILGIVGTTLTCLAGLVYAAIIGFAIMSGTAHNINTF